MAKAKKPQKAVSLTYKQGDEKSIIERLTWCHSLLHHLHQRVGAVASDHHIHGHDFAYAPATGQDWPPCLDAHDSPLWVPLLSFPHGSENDRQQCDLMAECCPASVRIRVRRQDKVVEIGHCPYEVVAVADSLIAQGLTANASHQAKTLSHQSYRCYALWLRLLQSCRSELSACELSLQPATPKPWDNPASIYLRWLDPNHPISALSLRFVGACVEVHLVDVGGATTLLESIAYDVPGDPVAAWLSQYRGVTLVPPEEGVRLPPGYTSIGF